jgi:hypothetical protein
MKVLTATRNVLFVILFSLALAIALPATAFGQGRGNGRGRGPDLDKKCGKFVNCHDARDGRWDGRGPRRNFGVFRNGIFIRRERRNRRIHQFDDENLFRSRRLRPRNRDFDDDDFFRGRSLRNRINNDELFRARRFHRR